MAEEPENIGQYNVDIPDSVITEVMTHLNAINDIMKPYYQALSEDEKDHLPAIADETIPFADKANGFLDSEPKYNPQYIDVKETHKDYQNFKKVLPAIEKIQGIEKNFVNIRIAASSDAYIQFLSYYNNVRYATKRGVAGAKTVYDELAKRFPRRSKKTTPPTP